MIVLSIINNLPHPRKNSFSFSLDLYKSKLISITPPSIPSTCSNIKFKKRKKLIIDELIYISFPNYIRKFLYLLHDQIDLVPSTNPSPSGVKSTRVTIKRPFRAWAIVTAQYSWRGTWCPPPSPLKSRIQRRSTMNSIK